MSERKRSRYTPQEKMEIIDEVRKKGSPVSEVCRRHGISVSLFYEWERKVKEATVTSLGGLWRRPTAFALREAILRASPR